MSTPRAIEYYTQDDIRRFWGRVKKTETCWIWQGSRTSSNYGVLSVGGMKQVGAHRFALVLAGEDLGTNIACHGCDNPPCVRVGDGHLFVGTVADNNRDMSEKGRRRSAGKGEWHHGVRLTEDQVREIIRRYQEGERQWSLADEFNVGTMQISRIVRGIRWAHIEGSDPRDGRYRNKGGRPRTRPTAELADRAKLLRQDGLTYEAIALDLGISMTLAWKLVTRY